MSRPGGSVSTGLHFSEVGLWLSCWQESGSLSFLHWWWSGGVAGGMGQKGVDVYGTPAAFQFGAPSLMLHPGRA